MCMPTKKKIVIIKRKYKFLKLQKNRKEPIAGSWQDNTTMKKDNTSYNYGLLTGKTNNITVIDLDTDKWDNNHKFIKTFGKDYIKLFNTRIHKTPGGGYHLIYKYDPDIKQTQNKKYNIDVRSDGGYIVDEGNTINDEKYNNLKYTIYNNSSIKNIPESLKTFLLDNILTSKSTQKTKEGKKQDNTFEPSTIKFYATPDQIDKILIKIKQKYFDDNIEWHKFTHMCKLFNIKDKWDTLSKTGTGYNRAKNMKIWDTIKPINYVKQIFKDCKIILPDTYETMLYKPTEPDINQPNEIINRNKLGQKKQKNMFEPQDKDYIKIEKISEDIVIIKSDTGTGKTTLFTHYCLKTQPKVLSICARTSLVDAQHQVFCNSGIHCLHYKTDKILKYNSAVTTIDSLNKCSILIEDIHEYVVFIDEANSLVEYLATVDYIKDIENKFNMFLYILKHCKKVIMVDADISDVIFRLTDYLQRSTKYIINQYKHNQGVPTEEYDDIDKIIADINTRDKYMVACDSKRIAQYIFLHTGKKGILIHSGKDNKLPEGTTLDDYDCVIFTPAIVYGLDSTMRRHVYAIMKTRTISPRHMLQQISRCRDITKLHFFFGSKKSTYPKYNSYKECHDIVNTTWKKGKNIYDIDNFEAEKLFNKIYRDVEYKKDAYDTNKPIHLKLLLKDRGFILDETVEPIIKPTMNAKQIKNAVLEYELSKLDLNDVNVKDKNEKYLGGLTIEQLEQIPEIFVDDHLLTSYFLVNKFYKLVNDDRAIEDINETNKDKNDFVIKKFMSQANRMIFLEKFKKKVNYQFKDNCDIYVPEFDTMDFTKEIDDYKSIFRCQSFKPIEINDRYDCENIIYKMTRQIYGDLFRGKKIKVNNKNRYRYHINDEYNALRIYDKIQEFQKINNKSICMF